jgi:hypothetical protein
VWVGEGQSARLKVASSSSRRWRKSRFESGQGFERSSPRKRATFEWQYEKNDAPQKAAKSTLTITATTLAKAVAFDDPGESEPADIADDAGNIRDVTFVEGAVRTFRTSKESFVTNVCNQCEAPPKLEIEFLPLEWHF